MASMAREVHDEVPVLVVEGEIDASNTPELSAEIRSMLSNAGFAVVVDVARVSYFDSAGLNALAVGDREFETRQQHLHVVAPPSSRPGRLLAITHLDSVLSVHDTLDGAVQAARAHG
jgi:anti-anti-sigma factor